MAEQTVFDKLHVDEKDKSNLVGILEQFNLPPKAIEYIDRNKTIIYSVLAIIAIVIVCWSLYGSYTEKKITESTSALAIAMDAETKEKIDKLENVARKYSGTDAATWAQVNIAQIVMEEGNFQQAQEKFIAIQAEISKEDALYPLIEFGMGQCDEALGNFDKALEKYKYLQKIKGFESLGYTGSSRIYEIQKEYDSAIHELEKYLGVMVGEESYNQEKTAIETKINQLQGMK